MQQKHTHAFILMIHRDTLALVKNLYYKHMKCESLGNIQSKKSVTVQLPEQSRKEKKKETAV